MAGAAPRSSKPRISALQKALVGPRHRPLTSSLSPSSQWECGPFSNSTQGRVHFSAAPESAWGQCPHEIAFSQFQPRGSPGPLLLKFSGLGSAGPNFAEALARSWGSWRRDPKPAVLNFRGAKGPRGAATWRTALVRLARTQTFRRFSRSLSFLSCSRTPLDVRTFSSGKRIPRAAALSPSSGIFLRIPTSWPQSLWGFPFNQPCVLVSSSTPELLLHRPGIHDR